MPIGGALSEVLGCRPGSDRARTPPWSAVATGLSTAGGDRPAGHTAGLGRLSSGAAFRRFRRPLSPTDCLTPVDFSIDPV